MVILPHMISIFRRNATAGNGSGPMFCRECLLIYAQHAFINQSNRRERIGIIRLTKSAMRHNNTYSNCLGWSDGQSE